MTPRNRTLIVTLLGLVFSSCNHSYQPTFVTDHPNTWGVQRLVWFPNSSMFLTAIDSRSDKVFLWKVGQKDPVDEFSIANKEEIQAFTVSEDGQNIFLCSNRQCNQFTHSPKRDQNQYALPAPAVGDIIRDIGVLPQTGQLWVKRNQEVVLIRLSDSRVNQVKGDFSVDDLNIAPDGKKILFRTLDPITGKPGVQVQDIPSGNTRFKLGNFVKAMFNMDGTKLILVSEPFVGININGPISVIAVDISDPNKQQVLVDRESPADKFTPSFTVTQGNQMLEIRLASDTLLEVNLSTLAVNKRQLSVAMPGIPCIAGSGNYLIYGPRPSLSEPPVFTGAQLFTRGRDDLSLFSSTFSTCFISSDERRLAIPFTDRFGGGIAVWNITGING